MLEFDIKIGTRDLYDYMLRHNYSSAGGIMGTSVGALLFIAGVAKGTWMFIIWGIILLLYLPVALFIKSAGQATGNPAFKKPLHYVFDDEGMEISQGEAVTKAEWKNMVKAVSTGRSIILYTSRINATIFPKAQLKDNTAALIEFISTHMPADKVKIRG
ncbi:MAG: YcxB family protein [Lachnospiraceae bacterium]|nr:YcxB family protein [Lachnospiraceae bacterium]